MVSKKVIKPIIMHMQNLNNTGNGGGSRSRSRSRSGLLITI